MQTAQNDAARLSSMVLKVYDFTKKLKIKILRFKKEGELPKTVLVTKLLGNGPFEMKISANGSE